MLMPKIRGVVLFIKWQRKGNVMKVKFLTLLLSSSLISACGGGSSADNEPPVITPPEVTLTKEQAQTKLLAAQADNYIMPAYQALTTEAENFEQASIDFCSENTANESSLTSLKNAWLSLSKSWQFAKAIKMGPESEDFRHFRMQFWPDNNRAVARGVASLLAAQTIDLNAVQSLQDGAQGLPALEVLIFTQGQNSLLSASDSEARCLAVMAIAENIKSISATILEKWQNSQTGFVNDFKDGAGQYETKQAVLEDFVTNWFELIEVIKDNKINDVKGTLLPGVPEKAESYLSKSSFENIKQNFAALETAYLAGQGYGFDEYLVDIHENTEVNETILAYFNQINSQLNTFDSALSKAVTESTERDKLVTLVATIDELRSYLATDFIQVTGLNPNFNSNDGD